MPSVTPERIAPPAVIGMIGGGQLGRMSALAARAMGYRVVVLEPKSPCACSAIVEEQIEAPYDDPDGLDRLFALADVVTFEFENVRREPLEAFLDAKPIRPSPRILSIAQNREREKTFLAKNGFPVTPFRVIGGDSDVEAALDGSFPFPAILKTADFGYDGKGQVTVASPGELVDAWRSFAGSKAVLEKKVAFAAEYSVIVVRNPYGEIRTYPLCRNIHRNHILDVTLSPADSGLFEPAFAEEVCRELAESLALEGVLVVELFYTNEGEWIINEMAPRPHNSGHFSLDGSVTSQFENHIRAVCNQPLGSTASQGPAAMQNLLGETLRSAGEDLASIALGCEGAHLHLYDKGEAKDGRKMGHINLTAARQDVLQEQLARLRKQLKLPDLPI